MLANLKDLLKRAQKNKAALGAFNAINIETAQAIVSAAENCQAPVIVETSPGAIKYAGIKNISDVVKNLSNEVNVPIVLHLDHGLSIEDAFECIEAGFNSVMIDGSHLPLIENITLTKKVVEIGHKKGVPVEGEVGTLTEHFRKTKPEEAEEFVRKTKVDALAVAIGSSHGHAANEELDLELLEVLKRKVDVPLVLHGASGVSDDDIKEAIARGICKINIATDIKIVFTKAIRGAFEDAKLIEPRDYLTTAKEAVQKLVEEKILLFGSVNV